MMVETRSRVRISILGPVEIECWKTIGSYAVLRIVPYRYELAAVGASADRSRGLVHNPTGQSWAV